MKVLIAYYSTGGVTQQMAAYIAEGLRFSAQEVTLRKMVDINGVTEMAGFDGYIFGSPTISLDAPKPVKAFLSKIEKASLEGKLGGAFGPYSHDVSYRHDTHAPAIILDSLQRLCKMKPFELGPLILQEALVDTSEGIKACQDYGRIFGEKLSI